MRRNCCHGFLAFNLKFFNFVQFFVGILMVVYSIYVLTQCHNHAPVAPAPSVAPAPDSPDFRFYRFKSMPFRDRIDPLYLADGMVSGSDELADLDFSDLPALWFIYCFMGVGALLCSISCIGHIAAEASNGCCLCFVSSLTIHIIVPNHNISTEKIILVQYTLLITMVLFLEGTMVAFIAIDHSWEKVLPFDPTGELESLKDFIQENADLCKWVGIALIAAQALSLLLAFVLRAMVTIQRENSDIEDNYADPRAGNKEPLLTKQPGQASASVKGEVKTNVSDIWSSRMREKYGLHGRSSKYMMNQNPPKTHHLETSCYHSSVIISD
ncbi:hypothetical protein V2J09_002234 [Rumex salicifolius]